jgi:hypothetical protein
LDRTPGGLLTTAANGFLTALDPEIMLQCLVQLASDPSLARTMGRCGREFVLEKHSAERLRDEIEQLYFDLAAESSSDRLRHLAQYWKVAPLRLAHQVMDRHSLSSS